MKRNKPSPRKKKKPDSDTTSSATSATPPKSGDWMGRLGTQKSIPVRKSRRIKNKHKPPASKTSVVVSPANRNHKPTMLKLQVGALVKKNLRLSIIHHNKMAITFGIVKRKLQKSSKWHIQFENGDNMILLPNEFEMVANDSNQKKLCFTPNKKITLKTPQEAHIESFSKAMKLGTDSNNTSTTIDNTNDSSITTNTTNINNTNGSSITNLVSPSNEGIMINKGNTTGGGTILEMEYLNYEQQNKNNLK